MKNYLIKASRLHITNHSLFILIIFLLLLLLFIVWYMHIWVSCLVFFIPFHSTKAHNPGLRPSVGCCIPKATEMYELNSKNGYCARVKSFCGWGPPDVFVSLRMPYTSNIELCSFTYLHRSRLGIIARCFSPAKHVIRSTWISTADTCD